MDRLKEKSAASRSASTAGKRQAQVSCTVRILKGGKKVRNNERGSKDRKLQHGSIIDSFPGNSAKSLLCESPDAATSEANLSQNLYVARVQISRHSVAVAI